LGPIDIRYHVVSLVAVFLALGVGIVVGSNTHLVGTDTLIEKQDQIIRRVQVNFAAIQKERSDAQAALKANQEYVTRLEQTVIPTLFEGKLAGARLGAVIVGTLPDDSSESVVLGPLKKAGATIGFKMKLPLDTLAREAAGHTDAALKRLAAELLLGNAVPRDIPHRLSTEGLLLFGDFSAPVNGVVFILGTDLDVGRVQSFLVLLEGYVRANRGIVANAMFTGNDAVEAALRRPNLSVYTDVQSVAPQSAMITELSEALRQAATKGAR
jgi:hypothetical protein